MKEDKPEPKILKRKIITGQSYPRMVEFRRSCGEFESNCKQKIIKLQITEYETGPDNFKVTTEIGYYEGKPPSGYREFFRKLYPAAFIKVMKDEKRRKASG